MADHNASRTLVKSAPELWAECSDATSLARHLRAFGKIRITQLEPETAVAWEGDAVSGTVRLEPSGWGTRVILSAKAAAPEPVEVVPGEPVEVAPEATEVGPTAVETAEEHNPPKVGALSRLLARLGLRRMLEPETSTVTAEPETSTVTAHPEPLREPAAALDAALDSLGRAHHRPYSRA